MSKKQIMRTDVENGEIDNLPIELSPELLDAALNGPYPNVGLFNFYTDLEERTLYIDCDVDAGLTDLSRCIIRWNREDKGLDIASRKPIKIMIYSYGGDVDACWHFIDIIKLSKTPIYTYNIGVAMSAGLYIFIAGHKRFTLPNGQFLLHTGSGGTQGTFDQTEKQMAHYKNLIERFRDYIMQRTTIPAALYKKKQKEEWFIYAEEAVKLGIADVIIDSLDELI